MGTSVRDGAPRRLTPAPGTRKVQRKRHLLLATIERAGPLEAPSRSAAAGARRHCQCH